MKHSTFSILLAIALGAPAAGQNTFDYDRTSSPTFLPAGLLTENCPGPPATAIPASLLGLTEEDEINALSYGDDFLMLEDHALTFSVDRPSTGIGGTGTQYESTTDTAPGTPPSAAGDLFVQELTYTSGNMLAPPGAGYDCGTTTGDESNASFGTSCVSASGATGPSDCDDLDAFDYSEPFGNFDRGVFFSLQPGSPTLFMIGATAGDILYSDLTGGPPVIAMLEGAGPANSDNLGILGMDLDALNLVGRRGPVSDGGGTIFLGQTAPSLHGTAPPSTHLLQFSVSLPGLSADIFTRIGPGIYGIHTPAGALGLVGDVDNVNALEVVMPEGCQLPATVFSYNGSGINQDVLTAPPVFIGTSSWKATIAPEASRGPGVFIVLVRGNQTSGTTLDLGLLFSLPPAGASELLVAAPFYANMPTASHGGGGTTASTVPAFIPNDCSLLGRLWYAQAVVFGDLPGASPGLLDPWFSTAVGGMIGSF